MFCGKIALGVPIGGRGARLIACVGMGLCPAGSEGVLMRSGVGFGMYANASTDLSWRFFGCSIVSMLTWKVSSWSILVVVVSIMPIPLYRCLPTCSSDISAAYRISLRKSVRRISMSTRDSGCLGL